jgi:two-component sensor histidine kinase/putative methionine-R-sulfoxide reductase with GAF domain
MASGNSHNPDRILARLREYQRALESLSRIGPEEMPPERLMAHAAAQVSRVTHIERTKVMRYRPDHGDLLIEAGVGWNEGVVGRATLAVDYRSPAGRAVQTGAPVAIYDFNQSSEYRMPQVLREHGIVSLLNVPIIINGAIWGVLEIDGTQPFAFDELDVSFLGTFANMLGTCLALGDARQQNIEAQAALARDRGQSEIRMRELQHRIKNNLQIIIASLSIKQRGASTELRRHFDDIIARVQAIALAQDLLSAGKQPSHVEFAQYLRSLAANIDPQRADLTVEVQAEQVDIPIDRAVPAGLVVNELVTNSIKYAFDNDGGRIWIRFRMISNSSEACVTVEDDGKGMDVPPKKGLGLTLIEGFAQQIQGRVEYIKLDKGSRAVLCFPVII